MHRQAVSHIVCHLLSLKTVHSRFLTRPSEDTGVVSKSFPVSVLFCQWTHPFLAVPGVYLCRGPSTVPCCGQNGSESRAPPTDWQGTFPLNPASDCTGPSYSNVMNHWLTLGLRFLISVDFHRSGPGFSNNPLGLRFYLSYLNWLTEYLLFFTVVCLHDFHLKSKALLALIQHELPFLRGGGRRWLLLCCLWDLSSLTKKDWTCAWRWKCGVLTTGLPGSSPMGYPFNEGSEDHRTTYGRKYCCQSAGSQARKFREASLAFWKPYLVLKGPLEICR